MNCNAPEMLKVLLTVPQRGIAGRLGRVPASTIPAAAPIARYPIKTGSVSLKALCQFFFFIKKIPLLYGEDHPKFPGMIWIELKGQLSKVDITSHFARKR